MYALNLKAHGSAEKSRLEYKTSKTKTIVFFMIVCIVNHFELDIYRIVHDDLWFDPYSTMYNFRNITEHT